MGAADYVEETARTLAGEASVLHDNQIVDGARYVNVWSGGGLTLGNIVTNVRMVQTGTPAIGTDFQASFAVLTLPEVLPPLVVALRRYPPYLRAFVKEWTLESEDFNQRYLVMALDREYVSNMVTPRLMELLMTQNDWMFLLEGSRRWRACARHPSRPPTRCATGPT